MHASRWKKFFNLIRKKNCLKFELAIKGKVIMQWTACVSRPANFKNDNKKKNYLKDSLLIIIPMTNVSALLCWIFFYFKKMRFDNFKIKFPNFQQLKNIYAWYISCSELAIINPMLFQQFQQISIKFSLFSTRPCAILFRPNINHRYGISTIRHHFNMKNVDIHYFC